MHVFISAGEPSGDLHGANLARALRARLPQARLAGFGGERMKSAGVEQLYPLTDLAVMWLGRVLANLPTFFRVAKQAEDYFMRERPDAVVLIDYPGFHWHIAQRARAAGIPCYYFVPPQLWAWAGWRVRKMRKNVDCVLTALPFEEEWYARRGVRTQYVGHPYFDDISTQKLDPLFLEGQTRDPRPIVALLPGSRNQEVSGNLPLLLNTALRIHSRRPDVRFLVAAYQESQAEYVRRAVRDLELPIEVHAGLTPEIIEAAQCCCAVSGSVSLELLSRRKPSVIVYRVGHVLRLIGSWIATCKYITLVNLLADRAIFPEFITTAHDEPRIAEALLDWLNDDYRLNETAEELRQLHERVGQPGACDRAASVILQLAESARRAA